MFWNVVPKYKRRRHVTLRRKYSKKKIHSKERSSTSKKPKQAFYLENDSYIATKNLLKNNKNEVLLGAVVGLIKRGVLPVDQVITLEHLKSAGLLNRKSQQVCLVGRYANIPFPIRIECTSVTYSAWNCISASGGQVICLFLPPLYLQAYLFADEWSVTKDIVGRVVENQKWSNKYPNRNAFHVPFLYVNNFRESLAPGVRTYSKPIGLQGLEFLHDEFCREIIWNTCIQFFNVEK